MTNFQIITDSGCLGDLSFYEKNNVDIIPFQAIIDGKFYSLDTKFPLSNTQIEKIIKNKKDFIILKPNYLDLKNVYERHLREGRNLLLLHSSSSVFDVISGASLAVKELKQVYPEREIILIDTETIACGIDFLIREVLNHPELSLYETSNFIKKLNYKIASRIIINKYDLNHQKNYKGIFRKNCVLRENNGYITPYTKYILTSSALYNEIKMLKKNIDLSYPTVYLVCSNDEFYAKRIVKAITKHLDVNIIRIEPNALFLHLIGKKSIGLFYVKR